MRKVFLAFAVIGFAVLLTTSMPAQSKPRLDGATNIVEHTDISARRYWRGHRHWRGRQWGYRHRYWGPRYRYWGPRYRYWGPRYYWGPRRVWWGPRYRYWGPRYYWAPRYRVVGTARLLAPALLVVIPRTEQISKSQRPAHAGLSIS